MPMLNADEQSSRETVLGVLCELSIEQYFAASPLPVSGSPNSEAGTDSVASTTQDPVPETGQTDRRREPRICTNAAAFVMVLNPAGHNRCPAQILDISRNGMKIRMEHFLLPGALILVRVGAIHVVGKVRHCSGDGPEFLAGVEISRVV